ncbi:MAG: hypothetical protein JSW16_08955 [Dehalococcoidales bacterium]|nr:MAG: hypothetical protein JSW16_08955 [Dehalococcoidales bacterium]
MKTSDICTVCSVVIVPNHSEKIKTTGTTPRAEEKPCPHQYNKIKGENDDRI